MITPKKAAELAARANEPMTTSVTEAAAALEPTIDAALVAHGRAAVSSSSAPPPGAVRTFPKVVVEVERRYRASGWVTKLDGGTLLLERPSKRRSAAAHAAEDWQCKKCGAMSSAGERCGACRAPSGTSTR